MWKNVDFEGRSVKVLFGTWLVILYSCLVTTESQSRQCGRGLSISLKLVSSHIHLSSWGRIHWFWMPDFYRNSFVLVCRFWLLNRFRKSHDQLRSYCKRQGKKKQHCCEYFLEKVYKHWKPQSEGIILPLFSDSCSARKCYFNIRYIRLL